jgi:drug/metabolite transporter (DMT)-like permease
MSWLSLGLICALSLATADALTKKVLLGYSAPELALVRFSWSGILLAPLALARPWPALPGAFWMTLAVLIPLELLAIVLYMRAIRDDPLYLTLPYLAFTPVFVAVTGYLVLDERVSVLGTAGILLVVAGAWLLNLHENDVGGGRSWLAPVRAIVRRRGSRLMLSVAFIYSLTSVYGKAAMQYMDPDLFGPLYAVLLGVAAVVLHTLWKPRGIAALWRRPLWHAVIGGLFALMIFTHFLALAQVETAYMITVKRTSLLFGMLYGAWLFKERRLLHNLGAGSLMVLGVLLVTGA